MRGKVSSQNREGNQTVYLVSEVAFEAISELEGVCVHQEDPSNVVRSWNDVRSCGKEQ